MWILSHIFRVLHIPHFCESLSTNSIPIISKWKKITHLFILIYLFYLFSTQVAIVMSIIFLKLIVCDTLKSCYLAIQWRKLVLDLYLEGTMFHIEIKKNTFLKTIIIKHNWEEASLSLISTTLIQFADCDTDCIWIKYKARDCNNMYWQSVPNYSL